MSESIYYNGSSFQKIVWGLTFAYNSQEIPATQSVPQSESSPFVAKFYPYLED